MMATMNLAIKQGLTIEEVDKLTGPISGRPKSATFRTADIVGSIPQKTISIEEGASLKIKTETKNKK